MEATLRQNLVWPNLKNDVEEAVKKCHECQIGKKVRKLERHMVNYQINWQKDL
jgi:hypothetical protein